MSPKINTRFNTRCYSGTEWSSGDGDGDDDDDDPNEVQLDDGDDGYDLPSSGRNFPSRLLPVGELSLSRVSAPWRRQNFPWMIYYVLGLRG